MAATPPGSWARPRLGGMRKPVAPGSSAKLEQLPSPGTHSMRPSGHSPRQLKPAAQSPSSRQSPYCPHCVCSRNGPLRRQAPKHAGVRWSRQQQRAVMIWIKPTGHPSSTWSSPWWIDSSEPHLQAGWRRWSSSSSLSCLRRRDSSGTARLVGRRERDGRHSLRSRRRSRAHNRSSCRSLAWS